MTNKINTKISIILVLILITGMFTGCAKEVKTVRYETEVVNLFDTASTIIAYSTDETEFEKQSNLVYDELKILHELFDIYNDMKA